MTIYLTTSQSLVIADNRKEAAEKVREATNGTCRVLSAVKISERDEAPSEWPDVAVIGEDLEDVETPEPEKPDMFQITKYPHSKVVGRWGVADFFRYIGKPQCRYMWKDWVTVAKFCIVATDKEFQNRPPIYISDNCSTYGQCPGHSSAHGPYPLSVWDGLYYTRKNVPGGVSEKVNAIWHNRASKILYTQMFDWERQYFLFKSLSECCPNLNIMIDGTIWECMRVQIHTHLGSKEGRIFEDIAIQQSNGLGHDTHFHIDLGNSLSGFYKLKQSLKG